MTVEEKLRRYIDNNGIKIVFVAEKAGIDENLLGKSLNGKRVLKSHELIGVCTVLGLDFNFFTRTNNLQTTG